MEPVFKLATVDDLELLVKFVQEFYEYDPMLLPFNQSATRTVLEKILTHEALGRVWLIQKEGEAIGYVVLTFGYSLEYRGRDAFIDELFIQEGDRGQGTGTKTLEFIEQACHSLKVNALHLEVNRSNTKAQSLYQKAGFIGHDRHLMSKWITPEDDHLEESLPG